MKKILLISFILFAKLISAIDQELLKASENLDVAKTKALYEQICKTNYRLLSSDEYNQVNKTLSTIVKREELFINPFDYSLFKKYKYYKHSNYIKIGISIITTILASRALINSYNVAKDLKKQFHKQNFYDFEFSFDDLKQFIKSGNFIYDTNNTNHDTGIILPFITLSGIVLSLSIWQIAKNIQILKRKEKAAQVCDILKSTLRLGWR